MQISPSPAGWFLERRGNCREHNIIIKSDRVSTSEEGHQRKLEASEASKRDWTRFTYPLVVPLKNLNVDRHRVHALSNQTESLLDRNGNALIVADCDARRDGRMDIRPVIGISQIAGQVRLRVGSQS